MTRVEWEKMFEKACTKAKVDPEQERYRDSDEEWCYDKIVKFMPDHALEIVLYGSVNLIEGVEEHVEWDDLFRKAVVQEAAIRFQNIVFKEEP